MKGTYATVVVLLWIVKNVARHSAMLVPRSLVVAVVVEICACDVYRVHIVVINPAIIVLQLICVNAGTVLAVRVVQ